MQRVDVHKMFFWISKWFQNECIIILRNLLLDATIYGIKFLHDFLLSKRYEIQEKFDTLNSYGEVVKNGNNAMSCWNSSRFKTTGLAILIIVFKRFSRS